MNGSLNGRLDKLEAAIAPAAFDPEEMYQQDRAADYAMVRDERPDHWLTPLYLKKMRRLLKEEPPADYLKPIPEGNELEDSEENRWFIDTCNRLEKTIWQQHAAGQFRPEGESLMALFVAIMSDLPQEM